MKKLVALSLALVLVLAFSVSASASSFSDTVNHADRTAIEEFVKEGYIEGYEDGTFRPNGSITRAEFCTIIMRAFDYETPAALTFTDTPEGAWYYDAVALGVGAGYINGYEDNTFRPTGTITREEAASILCKMLGVQENAAYVVNLTDADQMTWSRGYVGACLQQGVMTRYTDNSFQPKQNLTRAEAVVSLRATLAKVGTGTNNAAMTYLFGAEATAVSFEFKVLNSVGAPVSGAKVTLSGGALNTSTVSRTTGNDGVATFNNTALASYQYEVEMDDFTTSTGSVSVTSSKKEQTVTLASSKEYKLTIIALGTEDKAELKNATVELLDLKTSTKKETNDKGEAVFEGLPPGYYSYKMTFNGNTTTGSVNVTKDAQTVTDNVSTKDPKYTLKVEVLDSSDNGLRSAVVSVADVSGTKTTGSSGWVDFSLESGNYTVTVEYEGKTQTKTVNLNADKTLTFSFSTNSGGDDNNSGDNNNGDDGDDGNNGDDGSGGDEGNNGNNDNENDGNDGNNNDGE